jgi:hypothetical protein
VEEVKIQRPEGPLLLRRQGPKQWRLEEPVSAPADPSQVESLLSQILRARKERNIEERPKSLAPYGLDHPEVTIRVKAKGEGAERMLRIGKKNPTEVYYYAQLDGESSVFLVWDTLRRAADRKVFDLRDKRLWNFAKEEVVRVEIASPQTSVVMRRMSDDIYDWRIEVPGPFRADGDAVEAFLFRLSQLHAVAFVDHPQKPLSQLGLEPPRLTVTLHTKGKDRTLRLEIGKEEVQEEGGKRRLYARVAGRSVVVLLDYNRLGEVSAEAKRWRERALFDFAREDAQRFDLRYPGVEITCRKVDKDNWEIVQPETYPADSLRVNDFLWSLKDARAEEFVDGSPPNVHWEKPLLEVSLWVARGQEPLRLVVASEEGKKGLYAKAPVQDGIVLVSPKLLDQLKVTVKDLRDRRLLRFNVPKVHRILMEWKGKKVELLRTKEDWVARGPEEEAFPLSTVNAFLWSLRDLEFEEELSPTEASDVGQRGRPQFHVRLWDDKGRSLGTLTIGRNSPSRSGLRYAWRGESPRLYLIQDRDLKELKEDLKEILPDGPSDRVRERE